MTIIFLVQQAATRVPTVVKLVGMRQLGKYSGVNDEGTAYGKNFDLVMFESRSEYMTVRVKLEPEVRDRNIFVIVGGFAHVNPDRKSEYHWIATGDQSFFNLDVLSNQNCLGIRKEGQHVEFVPITCDEKLKFLCQEIDIQYTNYLTKLKKTKLVVKIFY